MKKCEVIAMESGNVRLDTLFRLLAALDMEIHLVPEEGTILTRHS